MQTSTVSLTSGPDRAELATVEFQGREFTAFGASIIGRRVRAYLRGPDGRIGDRGELVTFGGETIGTYVISGRWRTPRSYVSSHQVSARFRLSDGRRGYGRGAGAEMLFSGKITG